APSGFGGTAAGQRRETYIARTVENPARCQRTNVLGLTIARVLSQGKNRLNNTSVNFTAGVERRRRAFRSWYRASCRRRNRFSAMISLELGSVYGGSLSTTKEAATGRVDQTASGGEGGQEPQSGPAAGREFRISGIRVPSRRSRRGRWMPLLWLKG